MHLHSEYLYWISLHPRYPLHQLGVLYKDCGGDILEKNDEWTKIKSGDVSGWIKNQYLYFGKEAEELAKDVGLMLSQALLPSAVLSSPLHRLQLSHARLPALP